jgi:hypothetical protein
MVWMMPGADSSRAFIIVVMTYLVALGGLPHAIAGSDDGFFSGYDGRALMERHAMQLPRSRDDRKYHRRCFVGYFFQSRPSSDE